MKVVIDTREQRPWSFEQIGGLETVRRKLELGDYSVEGLEARVCIERKSLDDFVQSITKQKSRFWKELDLIRDNMQAACIVVEGSLPQVLAAQYTSKAEPASVLGLAVSIQVRHGIPVVWAGDRVTAIAYAAAWLRAAHKNLAE